MSDEACLSLPSLSAAHRAIARGSAEDWIEVGGTMLLRAGLIAAGLYLYDPKDKQILQRAAVGSVAIEAFVLGWVLLQKK